MSGDSLTYAGVVVDRHGFVSVHRAIRAWVMGRNTLFACAHSFQWLQLHDKAHGHRWRDVAARRKEQPPAQPDIEEMKRCLNSVALQFRRDAGRSEISDSLKVYDLRTGLRTHEFNDDFKEYHVVMFGDLNTWAKLRKVSYECWDDLGEADSYVRYCEIHDGIYFWDFRSQFTLPSGLTVSFSDFSFSKKKIDVWRRRFRRYAEFIAKGGKLKYFGDSGLYVCPGLRGIIADVSQVAVSRGESASSPGAVRRDLQLLHAKITELLGPDVFDPPKPKTDQKR